MALSNKMISVASEREEKFTWAEVRRGVFNIQVWLTATSYFAILAGLYSFGLFVSRVQWTSSAGIGPFLTLMFVAANNRQWTGHYRQLE